ncbi:MAG TPA: hypothetical protein VJ914_18305 [Pseudonocardiaceae bacterium]|nr:hypothetical protein [Pseudonocardiaceae bacterium]
MRPTHHEPADNPSRDSPAQAAARSRVSLRRPQGGQPYSNSATSARPDDDAKLGSSRASAASSARSDHINPHVALTTGRDDWDRGLDVVVEGDTVQVTDDATLHRLAAAWRTKWDGSWQFEVRDGVG